MLSDTIWSSGATSPHHATNYLTVLDQVDPEVAKMLGSSSSSSSADPRRFSFNEPDNSALFGFRLDSLKPVAYAASTGGVHGPHAVQPQISFGTASISGGIANRHPPQDSLLTKFAKVADSTRDIELATNFGSLNLNPAGLSRRTSFNLSPAGPAAGAGPSPHGSLNENLNINPARTSRHQLISEKIDSYNNNSPIQSSAALSISSDLTSNPPTGAHPSAAPAPPPGQPQHHPHSFWNPATATSFTPSTSYSYFMDGMPLPPQGFNPYGRTPPPFMVPSPPPAQFMDPSLFSMLNYADQPKSDKDQALDAAADVAEQASGSNSSSSSARGNPHAPGIGLANRQVPSSGFMFQGFNPYMYPQQTLPTSQGATPAGPAAVSPAALADSAGAILDAAPFLDPVAVAPLPPAAAPAPAPAPSGRSRKNGPKNGSANASASVSAGNGASSAKGSGGNHIYRSPLLEEVRSNFKGKEYFLKDIYGHAVEFTKDQHGSRFIQQKLPDATEEEKEVIFNEIRDISYDLMTDVFGNYVIQKYFEHGSSTQQRILLEYMIGHIYELSLQMYGCRVVQRALEAIDLDGQIQIIEELKDYILICAKDQNGNHVIQKSIERIPFDRITFILESLDNQIYHLSTHPYGCRVIQRLLEFSNIEDQKRILNELNRFIFYLIQDQYGNYVMQHILERGNAEDREQILQVVLGSVVNFSKHKFASNVIEKCIKYGTLDQRKRILHEVMVGNEQASVELVNDDSALALMVKDQYANYVIQKLVEGFDAKSDEKKRLVSKLRQYLKQISSKNTYGKHLASVEKMIIVAENALIEAEKSS